MKLLQTCTGREPGPPAYIYSFLLLFWVTLLLVRRSFVIFSLFYFSLGRSLRHGPSGGAGAHFPQTHRPVGQRATQNEERDREREDFYLFPSLPLVAVPPITSTLHAAVHYNIIKRLRDQRPAAVGSGATLHLESSARGSRKTPENNGRCITIDVVREGDPP